MNILRLLVRETMYPQRFQGLGSSSTFILVNLRLSLHYEGRHELIRLFPTTSITTSMSTSDAAIRMISSPISCNEAPHVDIVILSTVEVMYLGGQFGPIAVISFED